MDGAFSRTELLIGKEGVEVLSHSRVAVFGVGGVGGYAVEALARAGVGSLDVVDHDVVSVSNLNRQILATRSTVGQKKADVAEARIKDINPDCVVKKWDVFFLPETKEQFDFSAYDYVVDAVDTVAAKIALIEAAKENNVPIVCSMGAGNKLDPTAFSVKDIAKTSVDPLAKVLRKELKKRGISDVKVVCSEETPQNCVIKEGGRHAPGSVSFVPSVVGLILAGEVVKDLVNRGKQ